MPLTLDVTERSRRVWGAFPLQDAIAHQGATLSSGPPLVFVTPAGAWSHAVSLPARWTGDAAWIHTHDGVIRIRLDDTVGAVSLLAVDRDGVVIDEVRVKAAASQIEADLVSSPLGICHEIVLRNAQTDGGPSGAAVRELECIDIGPSQDGDRLAPDRRTLRAVEDWPRYYGGEGRSLAERVRSVRYSRLDRVTTMPWLEQLQVHIYPNDDLSRAVYISGLYEPSTLLALQRLLRPGARFIDVGANAGLFSMVASRWVGPHGHVHAFEPSGREYSRLVDHVTLNALHNVDARRQAIGDRNGVAQLRVAPFPNAGHNTLGASFAYPQVQTERIETVDMVTLDAFVRAQAITHVDAIKMDIEGSEHAALSGAVDVLDRFRPALIVECSRAALERCGSTPERLRELLTASRYTLHGIDPEGVPASPILAGDTLPDGDLLALPVDRPLI